MMSLDAPDDITFVDRETGAEIEVDKPQITVRQAEANAASQLRSAPTSATNWRADAALVNFCALVVGNFWSIKRQS
jgi:hypothetical protein